MTATILLPALPSLSVFITRADGQLLDLLRIWCTDCLTALRQLPSNSVHCIVTSPPYWMIRNYGYEGQLGQEPTLKEHIAALVAVFGECRRVLHASGSLWVNYRDVFSQQGKAATDDELRGHEERSHRLGYATDAYKGYTGYNRAAGTQSKSGIPRKNLLFLPHRLAIALQEDGWIARMDNVWHKPNGLSDSANDRSCHSHEYVFHFSKRPKYFYDDAVERDNIRDMVCEGVPMRWGRKKQSIWTINTEATKTKHTATFPKKLARWCILPSTSQFGCCPACLRPVQPVYRKLDPDPVWQASCGGRADGTYGGSDTKDYAAQGAQSPSKTKQRMLRSLAPRLLVGAQPGCKCLTDLAHAIPCTVLDPFCGSGTVGEVALQNGRCFVGIEMGQDYQDIAWGRLRPRAEMMGAFHS